MSEFSWGLMGYNPENPNNLGVELTRQIENAHERLQLESAPRWILRSSGLMKPDGVSYHPAANLNMIESYPDVIFVALPSTDDGEPAISLINKSLKRDATVITCEKGALANDFSGIKERSDDFRRFGKNATVGGGSRIMEKSQSDFRDPENVQEVHLALNGTLTYIFSSVGPIAGRPITPAQAVNRAIKLGYAEPGATDVISVIKNEAEGDIPKKVSIFLNQSGLLGKGDYLDWRELEFELSEEQINTALEEAKLRRFAVSLYSADKQRGPEKDILGGFDTAHDRWRIIGGFRNLGRNAILHSIGELTDADNCVITVLGPNEADGINPIPGPGAGASTTVNTMLDDYIRLVRDKTEV